MPLQTVKNQDAPTPVSCDCCERPATGAVVARGFCGYRCDVHTLETVAQLEAYPQDYGRVRVDPITQRVRR